MRKMQVPAYEPWPWGVHAVEYSGVVTLWKKTMAISAEDIMMDEDEEPISISIPPVDDGIELPLVIVIDIPVMLAGVDMVMSILLAEDLFLAKITLGR